MIPLIDIHHVERAVGRVGQVDRPEPLVRGAQELRPLIRLPRSKRRAVVGDDEPADDVRRGLGDEDVAVQVARQPVAPIHGWRAGGGVGRERAIRPQDALLIGAVGSRCLMGRPDVVDVAGRILERLVTAASPKQGWVAGEVRRGHQVHVQHGFVVVPIDAAGVVLRRAPLSARERSLYLERAIDVSQHHVGAGTRHVDAIVEPPQQGIGVHLDVGLAAPIGCGDKVFPVASEIAIRVAHQPDVRGLAHEHALLEDLHRQRLDQAVGEHRAPVHGAIAVRVLEHDDAADGLVLAGRPDIAHVAGQLDGPESSSRIPVDRNRILDERLARHQFEAVTGGHGERSERLRGREDGSPRRDGLHCGRPLPSRSRLQMGSAASTFRRKFTGRTQPSG